jgi:hypothetical protein
MDIQTILGILLLLSVPFVILYVYKYDPEIFKIDKQSISNKLDYKYIKRLEIECGLAEPEPSYRMFELDEGEVSKCAGCDDLVTREWDGWIHRETGKGICFSGRTDVKFNQQLDIGIAPPLLPPWNVLMW